MSGKPIPPDQVCFELRNMAFLTLAEDEGSEDQKVADDAFMDLAKQYLTEAQIVEWQAHSATTNERVQYGLRLLGMPL